MPVNAPKVIVTIDGPAGTGKSSVAGQLADRLGLVCLDTGAMYRCVALLAIRNGVAGDDASALVELMAKHEVGFDWEAVPPRILLDGEDVEEAIRTAEIGQVVSIVAAVPEVREAMVHAQREMAATHGRMVSEGRDQGSVVFPDADVRFYLTASAEIRAERRFRQMEEGGKDVSAEEIRTEINRRDHLDSSRTVGPLICPEGAIEVDTSSRSLEEVVDLLEFEVRSRVDEAAFPPC
ncbi:MAG: (d)CMP kinase [Phycisphaerales bacterium]|nr:(d)CMP kinase [Phycisphaerales bacterium]